MSYNRDNRSGGRNFGRRDSHKRDSEPRKMYKAICDECGKECEVPFKPSGDKPVYCSECFEKRNSGSSRRSSGERFRKPSFEKRDNTNNADKQLLEQVNSLNIKLDRILKVIELNVVEKPISKKTEVKKTAKKDVSKDKKIIKKVGKKKIKKSTD